MAQIPVADQATLAANEATMVYRLAKLHNVRIDRARAVGLVEIAVAKGKATRPDIKLGICGEHGGDPSSVEFCHKLGLTYVSCSPFRVPIARLAAAQANIKNPRN